MLKKIAMEFDFNGKSLDLSSPRIMGVLNMTPDSFSDGGSHFHQSKPSVELALAHVERMIHEGAELIDIGGESTRPGAKIISVQEEIDRVAPVIDAVAQRFDVVISVDTSTPQLMREAAKLGVGMINDVRALQKEDALKTLFDIELPVCIMHMLGEPQTMQQQPQYENITLDIVSFFKQRILVCAEAGISYKKIILDPGFGFGKTLEHNVQLMRSLDTFKALNCPLLVGVSRKSMIQGITGRPIEQRLAGGLALAVIAAIKGANILRVHDVKETADALKVYEAIFAESL